MPNSCRSSVSLTVSPLGQGFKLARDMRGMPDRFNGLHPGISRPPAMARTGGMCMRHAAR
ncbi:hypothetical protein SKB0092_14750 [Roseomonas mucosa]